MQADDKLKKINSILPDTCIPFLYKIILTIFTFDNNLFYHVTVKIKCKLNSNKERFIILNSVRESYSILNIKLIYNNKEYTSTIEESEYQESIKLDLSKVVFEEEILDIDLVFNIMGKIKDDKKALFYCFKNNTSTSVKDMTNLVIANCFAPAEARLFIPCFDLPHFKSEIKLFIVLSEEFKSMCVVSNTEEITQEYYYKLIEQKGNKFLKDNQEGFSYGLSNYLPGRSIGNVSLNKFKVHKFKKTPKMSIYLLNITVGIFEHLSRVVVRDNNPSVEIRVYYYKRQFHAQAILEKAVEAFVFYEDYFQIPFPLNKLDIIILPKLEFSGMENWGCILLTYSGSKLSSIPNYSQISFIPQIVFHEVSHMWFGNLVTMKSFRDLWLNEGFASFMEYFATQKHYKSNDLDYWSEFLRKRGLVALNLDSNRSRPMLVSDNEINPRNLDTIYDFVNYSKSSTIIFYALSIIGEEDFRKSIHIFLEKYKYSNAKTEDILDIFEFVSKKNVKISLIDFLKNPSYPIIIVRIIDHSIILEQNEIEEFIDCFDNEILYLDSEKIRESAIKTDKFWNIYLSVLIIFKKELNKKPFVFTFFNNKKQFNFTLLLKSTYTININEIEIFLINYDKFSYCRVIYEKELLSKIINNFNEISKVENNISHKNIVVTGILDDLQFLYSKKKISISKHLSIIKTLFSKIDNDLPLDIISKLTSHLTYELNPIFKQTNLWQSTKQFNIKYESLVSSIIFKFSHYLIKIEDKLNQIDNKSILRDSYEIEIAINLLTIDCEILEKKNSILILRKYLDTFVKNRKTKLQKSFKNFLLQVGVKFNNSIDNYNIILKEFLEGKNLNGMEKLLRSFKYIETESLNIIVINLLSREKDFIEVISAPKINFFLDYLSIHNLILALYGKFDCWKTAENCLKIFFDKFMRYVYLKEVYFIHFKILSEIKTIYLMEKEKCHLSLINFFKNDDFFKNINKQYLCELEKII